MKRDDRKPCQRDSYDMVMMLLAIISTSAALMTFLLL